MNEITKTLAAALVGLTLAGCSEEPDNASPWAGKSYLLSIGEGDWTEPRAIGKEIGPNVPSFLFQITGETEKDLTLTIGAGQPLATPETFQQNLCSPTQRLPFSGGSYPKVRIENPEPIRIHVRREPENHAPVQVTGSVHHLEMIDVFPGDGATASTGTFRGMMDFREIYRLVTGLGDTVTPDGACNALSDQLTPIGCEEDPSCWVRCEPCPVDDAPYCLTVKAEELTAIEMPGLAVVPVSEATRDASCVDVE
jgi:hypothetical protein